MSKEDKEWYKSYKICDEYMRFYSYKEFCDNARTYKIKYESTDIRTKKLYKLFIYAGLLRYDQKNAIWDFLNGYCEYNALAYHN